MSRFYSKRRPALAPRSAHLPDLLFRFYSFCSPLPDLLFRLYSSISVLISRIYCPGSTLPFLASSPGSTVQVLLFRLYSFCSPLPDLLFRLYSSHLSCQPVTEIRLGKQTKFGYNTLKSIIIRDNNLPSTKISYNLLIESTLLRNQTPRLTTIIRKLQVAEIQKSVHKNSPLCG